MRKSLQKAHADHEKFLRSMGVKGTGKKYRMKIPSYKCDTTNLPETTNQITKIVTKKSLAAEEKIRATQNYTLGQAYNKGGLQVISKSDAADPATGKRRA